MSIIGIEHVQLAMPEGQEPEARSFYSGLLGIPEVPKPPELQSRGGAWFESAHVRIHLGIDPDFRPAQKAHVGLVIEDLEALIQTLRSGGYEVSRIELLPAYRRVYVNDPFGNRLELMERRRLQ